MPSVQTGGEFDRRPTGGPSPKDQGITRPSFKNKSGSVHAKRGAPVTVSEVKDWLKLQIPYPNLADNEQIANRALNYVIDHKRHFEEVTTELRDRWRAINYMMRGFTLSRRFLGSDVHVGELYKAVETLVPLIEEALVNFDPSFHVKGREELDRGQADKIRHFLEYQLYKTRWAHTIQPNIRAALVYSFSPLKVFWDCQFEHRIKRDVNMKIGKDGSPNYRYTIKEEREVTWWGPRVKLVDPLSFFIDVLSVDPPHDTLFMGDETEMTMEEMLDKQEVGIFMNVDQLREQDPKPARSYTHFDKQVRNLETLYQTSQDRPPDGTPKRFTITECWGKFDPYDVGDAREYVITVADDKVVLRVQENPYDDKHKPYALARLGREGYEFFGVGPCDHGIKANIELDEHRNLAMKGHALSVSPLAFVSNNSDVPDSLFEAQAGQVYQADTPPTWFAPKSTVGELVNMEAVHRRDIEEYTGAYRIHEQPNQTATEVERKVQVRNMRVRSYIMQFSSQMEEVLSQFHAMNRQFVTRDLAYRVLGKGAKGLKEYQFMGPKTLDADVDFEFVGPSNLRTLGLRATNITTFLNQVYPLIQQYPGKVNIPAVIKELYSEIVGVRPSDEIIQDVDTNVWPQQEENLLLLQGQEVPVNELDDDEEHLRQMRPFLPDGEREDEVTDEAAIAFEEHRLAHVRQRLFKRTREQARSQDKGTMPMPSQEMDVGRGTTGRRREIGNGIQGPPPGEAPGPPMLSNAAAPDRYQMNTQAGNV